MLVKHVRVKMRVSDEATELIDKVNFKVFTFN